MDRFIAFDLETTGLNPAKGARILEVGAVFVEKNEVTNLFSRLINTKKKIPVAATKVNGITNEMVRHASDVEEVMGEFKTFIGNEILIAHNARFDIRFLRYEFARLGIGFKNKHLCTLARSRRLFPGLRNHRLATLYRHLFGNLPEEMTLHRALDDAKLVAKIWIKMQSSNGRSDKS